MDTALVQQASDVAAARDLVRAAEDQMPGLGRTARAIVADTAWSSRAADNYRAASVTWVDEWDRVRAVLQVAGDELAILADRLWAQALSGAP